MMENERIISLFQNLYDGEPWIDVTIKSTLAKLTAEQAAARVLDNCNTIWEIVNHLIAWRIAVKERIKGNNIKTPGNNYIQKVVDTSKTAWAETLKKLDNSQRDWVQFLGNINETDLQKSYEPGQMTNYELIQGIIQHDAYHLGQIIIIAKQGKENRNTVQ